jgi:trimeric autotransporter adhesin
MSFADCQGSASGSHPATSRRVIRKPAFSHAAAAALAIACLLTIFAPASRAQSLRPQNPQGRRNLSDLPVVTQARISRAMGRDQRAYQPTPEADGFRMENGRLSADLGPRGIEFAVDGNDWGMKLSGYGYGQKVQAANEVKPTADANRVEYRRDALTEWYVNGPLGVEQGFTVIRKPGESHGEPLTLALSLSGGLTASVDPGAHSLTLRKTGTAALGYTGLVARDARGRDLNTWLEIHENRLLLNVDDAGAQYPLTLDPIIQAAKLTASDNPGFTGISVGISADGKTVVAGAIGDFGCPVSQAAYVFVKSASGWEDSHEVAKLTPSDGVAGDCFGDSVAINTDGSVIVVGSPGATIFSYPFYNQEQGAIYVFTRPGSAWVSSTQAFKLSASDGSPGDFFGRSVAVSGDGRTVVAGEFGETTPGSSYSHGAAYVFVRIQLLTREGPVLSFFIEAAKLTNSDGYGYIGSDGYFVGDVFGSPVAISADGSTILVAASWWNIIGSVYVYVEPATGWASSTETAKLTSSDASAQFGSDISISDDASTIAVGTLQAPYPRGAIYVFARPGGGWATTSTALAKLTASDNPNFLGVSTRVSGDGDTIVGVAYKYSPSVYVYPKPPTGWANATENVQLPGDYNSALGLNGDGSTLAVGQFDDNDAVGAVYMFTGSSVPCECATDVSHSVTVTRSGYVLNLGTGRYAQTVTVTNNSASTIAGPISLVLDSLSSNAALFDATGTTDSLQPPAGSPYITTNVTLAPGQLATFGLQFTNPTRAAITYTTRVLAGPGEL